MNRRVEFLLFTAGWGANHFAALLLVYRKELALSPAALGILFGAYALGLVPGLILAGRISDRRGRRAIVLPAGMLTIAASTALAFGSQGFGVLLAGRLLYGLAMGSVMSPGSVWVQELSSAATGARHATLALSAGFGIGPLVSGVLAEIGPAPMVWPYIVHGVLTAVALILIRSVPETATATTGDTRAMAAGITRREWKLLAELLPAAPWSFGFAAVTLVILPGIMRVHVSRPVLYSAFVIVTTLGSGVLVQPMTKKLGRGADRLGLAIGALGIFLGARAVTIGSAGLVFAVAVLVGAAYGLVMTTGLLTLAERVPRQIRGTAVGVYYVLTYLGFALPFIHATAAATFGAARTLDAIASTALACLVIRAVIASRH